MYSLFHINYAMGKCCQMSFAIRYQINLLQMAARNITHSNLITMVNASLFTCVVRWKYNWPTRMSPVTFLFLEGLYQCSRGIDITRMFCPSLQWVCQCWFSCLALVRVIALTWVNPEPRMCEQKLYVDFFFLAKSFD